MENIQNTVNWGIGLGITTSVAKITLNKVKDIGNTKKVKFIKLRRLK